MRAASSVLAALGLATTISAQTYDDLTLVRGRPSPFQSVFQVKAGVSGSFADDDDTSIGMESETALDGHVYYRNGRFTAQEAMFEAYAGRDGAVLSIVENDPGSNGGRLELTARYAPFFRDGFYRSGDFIPTGRFEGTDYGAFLGFGGAAGEGLTVEIGPYIRKFSFDANRTTDPTYVLPDDFLAYGVRAFAEHNTLMLDRRTGRPSAGFILTIRFEAERNDSDRTFGSPNFLTRLPSGLWRGRAHLEWYIPQSDLGTWSIRVDGEVADDEDRISNIDAQQPIGHQWADGELGLRLNFGPIAVTPFASGQYVKALEESGAGSSEDFFYGGGVRGRYDFADSLAAYAEYSYLNNYSRLPVSTNEDVFGEHQFFVGVEVRIGAVRL